MPALPSTAPPAHPTVPSSPPRGVAVPKGTPPAVVAYLTAALTKAMNNPDHLKKMEDVGLEVRIMDNAEFRKYFDNVHETAKKYMEWAKKFQ